MLPDPFEGMRRKPRVITMGSNPPREIKIPPTPYHVLAARWVFLLLFGRLVDRGWELKSDFCREGVWKAHDEYDYADERIAELARDGWLSRDAWAARLFLFASGKGWY